MKYDLQDGCAIPQCEYLADYGCPKCGAEICGHHLDNHDCGAVKQEPEVKQ